MAIAQGILTQNLTNNLFVNHVKADALNEALKLLNDNPKPSKEAIKEVFEEHLIHMTEDLVNTILMDTADLRPSDESINKGLATFLKLNIKSNFKVLERLCFAKDNKREFTITENNLSLILTKAADAQEVNFVFELLTMEDPKQPHPSPKSREHAAARLGQNVEEGKKYISALHLKNKLSHTEANAALTGALNYIKTKGNWELIEYICCDLDSKYRPNPIQISSALSEANQNKKWDLVLRILSIHHIKTQDFAIAKENALKNIARCPLAENYLREMIEGPNKSQYQMTDNQIYDALKNATYRITFQSNWAPVAYLFSLQTIKNNKNSLNHLLQITAANFMPNHDIINKILCELFAMQGENAPDLETRMSAMKTIGAAFNSRLIITKFLDTNDQYHITSEEITSALMGAINASHLKNNIDMVWNDVKYLTGLKAPYQPSQAAIDLVLKQVASIVDRADLAYQLFTGANTPSVNVKNSVFLQLVLNSGISSGQIATMTQDKSLTQVTVDDALKHVASSVDRADVSYKLFTGTYGPSDKVKNHVFSQLVINSGIIPEQIKIIARDKSLTQNTVSEALNQLIDSPRIIKAAEIGISDWDLKIEALCTFSAPNSQTLTRVLKIITAQNKWDFLIQLIKLPEFNDDPAKKAALGNFALNAPFAKLQAFCTPKAGEKLNSDYITWMLMEFVTELKTQSVLRRKAKNWEVLYFLCKLKDLDPKAINEGFKLIVFGQKWDYAYDLIKSTNLDEEIILEKLPTIYANLTSLVQITHLARNPSYCSEAIIKATLDKLSGAPNPLRNPKIVQFFKDELDKLQAKAEADIKADQEQRQVEEKNKLQVEQVKRDEVVRRELEQEKRQQAYLLAKQQEELERKQQEEQLKAKQKGHQLDDSKKGLDGTEDAKLKEEEEKRQAQKLQQELKHAKKLKEQEEQKRKDTEQAKQLEEEKVKILKEKQAELKKDEEAKNFKTEKNKNLQENQKGHEGIKLPLDNIKHLQENQFEGRESEENVNNQLAEEIKILKDNVRNLQGNQLEGKDPEQKVNNRHGAEGTKIPQDNVRNLQGNQLEGREPEEKVNNQQGVEGTKVTKDKAKHLHENPVRSKELELEKEKQRRDKLVTKFNTNLKPILKALEDEISKVEDHNSEEAHQVALTLLEGLKKAKKDLLKDLVNLHIRASDSSKKFEKQCKNLIENAKPVLDKDITWSDYLTNLMKTILETVLKILTLGFSNTIFDRGRSKSIVAVEAAEANTHRLLV